MGNKVFKCDKCKYSKIVELDLSGKNIKEICTNNSSPYYQIHVGEIQFYLDWFDIKLDCFTKLKEGKYEKRKQIRFDR